MNWEWDDDFQGMRCRCGEWVAVMHKECRDMLPDEVQLDRERRP